MRELERIAGAGEILIVTRLIGQQPIIGGIVDAAITQRRAHMVALTGVVVDDIQDHLDSSIVQRRDGRAKIGDRVASGVARLRRKEAERVVAPIILQATLDQMTLIKKGMRCSIEVISDVSAAISSGSRRCSSISRSSDAPVTPHASP